MGSRDAPRGFTIFLRGALIAIGCRHRKLFYSADGRPNFKHHLDDIRWVIRKLFGPLAPAILSLMQVMGQTYLTWMGLPINLKKAETPRTIINTIGWDFHLPTQNSTGVIAIPREKIEKTIKRKPKFNYFSSCLVRRACLPAREITY